MQSRLVSAGLLVLACLAGAQAASVSARAHSASALQAPWEFPMDRSVELEQPMPKVNLLDPKVFDFQFYAQQNPNITENGAVDYKTASEHWVHVGLTQGLRSSPTFDVKVYLAKNRDLERTFGPNNYPFAVLHYLARGHLEKYRETGGPLRMNIFHPMVFDPDFYVRRNQLVSSSTATGFLNRTMARRHWRQTGLPQGLPASEDFNVKVYLDKNEDIRQRYGDQAYAAALNHFIEWGHKQTWRENGGSTCKYWATWCQIPDSAFTKILNQETAMPVFNATGTSITTPPVPRYAGRSVEINGRSCSDLSKVDDRPVAASRVAEESSLRWSAYNGTRGCSITIRHFIDVQTRISNQRVSDLSLPHWRFSRRVPAHVTEKPIPEPSLLAYTGFSYDRSVPRRKRAVPPPAPEVQTNGTNSTANGTSSGNSSTVAPASTVTPIEESGPIILPPPKSAPTETYRAIQSASHFKVAIKLVRQQDMTDETDLPSADRLQPTQVFSVVHHYELDMQSRVPSVQQKNGVVGVSGAEGLVEHLKAVDGSEEGKLGSDLLRFRRAPAMDMDMAHVLQEAQAAAAAEEQREAQSLAAIAAVADAPAVHRSTPRRRKVHMRAIHRRHVDQ